jgi:hypothetical protein
LIEIEMLVSQASSSSLEQLDTMVIKLATMVSMVNARQCSPGRPSGHGAVIEPSQDMLCGVALAGWVAGLGLIGLQPDHIQMAQARNHQD